MRLIDADALMELARNHVGRTVDCNDIARFPAVDAAPVVHARWIHDINNLYGCSACLERETMSHKKMKRFCPNCGAKMDGEDLEKALFYITKKDGGSEA